MSSKDALIFGFDHISKFKFYIQEINHQNPQKRKEKESPFSLGLAFVENLIDQM